MRLFNFGCISFFLSRSSTDTPDTRHVDQTARDQTSGPGQPDQRPLDETPLIHIASSRSQQLRLSRLSAVLATNENSTGNTPLQEPQTGNALPRLEAFKSLIENTAQIDRSTPGLRALFNHSEYHFAGPLTAVDLGAGGGRDTRAMVKNGWHVTAIDTSPHVHSALSKADPQSVQIIQGTLGEARLAANSIGLVNAQRVLPFIHDQNLYNTLTDIARVLRPGGYLCASFFGPDHSWNDNQHPRMRFHSMAEIRQLLLEAGLDLVSDKQTTGPFPAAHGGQVENWNEILIVAKKPAT